MLTTTGPRVLRFRSDAVANALPSAVATIVQRCSAAPAARELGRPA
ncbi:MAG: hypothetical protein KatS3mg060_0229 [Dehalococcoidia bacterium]|nr:MAG: hypothetical protein KatS3mg060_0229 [Dehalococcoidia bacterium]